MFKWIKDRCSEMSSWSGDSLSAIGVFIRLVGRFVKLAAWEAVAWGAWQLWHKDR